MAAMMMKPIVVNSSSAHGPIAVCCACRIRTVHGETRISQLSSVRRTERTTRLTTKIVHFVGTVYIFTQEMYARLQRSRLHMPFRLTIIIRHTHIPFTCATHAAHVQHCYRLRICACRARVRLCVYTVRAHQNPVDTSSKCPYTRRSQVSHYT
jgi:hypothetical protein